MSKDDNFSCSPQIKELKLTLKEIEKNQIPLRDMVINRPFYYQNRIWRRTKCWTTSEITAVAIQTGIESQFTPMSLVCPLREKVSEFKI